MEHNESQAVVPAPPQVIPALIAGFDSVTRHWGVLFFPIGLDFLLWFGPHLQVKTLLRLWLEQTISLAATLPDAADWTAALDAVGPAWEAMAEHINLLAALRAFPVGIPSLMVSILPLAAPGVSPRFIDLQSFSQSTGLILLLTGVGVLFGALYFALVQRVALRDATGLLDALRDWPRAGLSMLVLTVLWVGILMGLSVPLSLISSVLMAVGSSAGALVILMIFSFLLWLLVPLMFAPHGVFVHRLSVWRAIKRSVLIVRFTFPTTAVFLVGAVFISQVMDALWRIPPEDSWLMLIGVAGHAFVTTGLVAASFVYYHYADRWVQAYLERLSHSPRGES